ncbi:MAG: hypothetical protein AABY92_04050, partial [Thermodesulfobacteriota bacterium]
MTDQIKDKDVTSLEELLYQRKALLDITNRIHAAQNIKQILVDQVVDVAGAEGHSSLPPLRFG